MTFTKLTKIYAKWNQFSLCNYENQYKYLNRVSSQKMYIPKKYWYNTTIENIKIKTITKLRTLKIWRVYMNFMEKQFLLLLLNQFFQAMHT